jgi:hypothetical protein
LRLEASHERSLTREVELLRACPFTDASRKSWPTFEGFFASLNQCGNSFNYCGGIEGGSLLDLAAPAVGGELHHELCFPKDRDIRIVGRQYYLTRSRTPQDRFYERVDNEGIVYTVFGLVHYENAIRMLEDQREDYRAALHRGEVNQLACSPVHPRAEKKRYRQRDL